MTTSRWLVALALLGTLVVGGGWLAVSLAMGTTSGGCPTALLQGTLVERDGTLGVQGPDGGPPGAVNWPFGYAVERQDGALVLTRLFQVVAHEGEVVGVGGGMVDEDEVFDGCGIVTIGGVIPSEPTPEPTPEPGSTFVVAATGAHPCIPPPSGCGYGASLTSGGETWTAGFDDRRSYDELSNGTKAALQLGAGLPTTLEPGTYTVAFDLTVFSDMVSFDANGDEISPQPAGACSATVTVPNLAEEHAITVRVAFDGQDCTIEPSTFVEPAPR